jgi:hypothetical protein
MRALVGAATILAITAVGAVGARAGDLHDEPVGLRIGLALDRGSAFTDAFGLGASTAYPYGSSVNPAGGDFLRTPPNEFTIAGTLTGVYAAFDQGAAITALAGSATYRLPAAGTLIASYTRTDSHDARSVKGDLFTLRSNELSARYSHLVLDALSLGVGVKVSDSTLSFSSTVSDFPLRTETDSTGVELSAGGLVGLGPHWLLGLFATVGWTWSSTRGGVELPDAPFGPGPLALRFDDLTRSVNIRGGIGWRPSDRFGAYLDLQYLRLRTDEDSAEAIRVWSGVEYLPIPAVALRIGASRDTDGQTSVSGGIGVYGKHVQVELAYSYNAFPEVRREFGRAHVASVSIVLLY